MAGVTFTKELAEATCKVLNKHKDRGLECTGGKNSEAVIYNAEGSISIDFYPQTKKYYLEIEKEVSCNYCGRSLMFFESSNLEDVITIVKCYES